MEDLASFIQTLSEKYGLLDFGSDKLDSTVTNHFQIYAPSADEEQEDHGQENCDGLGVDTSWECLTSFLNKHDLQHTKMHNFHTKKSSLSKRRERNRQLPHDDQGVGDVEAAESLNRPQSGSSDRAPSLANTIETSDLIQTASFLDELQNPSLSEDLQSTGMTKGRDSLDENDHVQTSLLQEFLVVNGEKDVDVMEFAKEMGLSSFNEYPQKEDVPWHANSDAWFREFGSTRTNLTSSSQRLVRMDRKIAEEECLDRELLAHDILTSNDILLSSGSSSSPTGTELDGQMEDCHSASASQRGGDAAVARSRCASPEGFAEALESVERGRERASIVNARVEKMLVESDSHHSRAVQQAAEAAGGKSLNSVREDNYAAEDAGKMSGLRFGIPENGSVGSLKQRMADVDEGKRLLLTQLDKSRSLLSPSKQPTLFRSRSSASDRGEAWRQIRRSSEEVGDRSERDDNASLRQLDEGDCTHSRHSQEKVSSPHEDDSLSRASSRGERDHKPDSGASSIQEEEDSGHGAKAASHYLGQRRESSRNQDIDHQPLASPVDQLPRFNIKIDSSGDRRICRNLRIRIPNFQPSADQYDPRITDGQDLPENQVGIYCSRETLTQDRQKENNGSLAISPRIKQSDVYDEIREGREKFETGQPILVLSSQNHQIGEGFCARIKEYYNFTSSWGNEWTEVEEEVIEARDPTPIGASVGQSKWERVNNLLCQNGFPTIRCSNVPVSDFEEDCHLLLSDVVSNYERREKFVQALLEEGDELRQVEERNHLHIQQLESERDEVKQKLAASDRRAEVAAKAAERSYAALRRDCQKLESSNANLMQRCSQLEHACRAKERTLQKLQDKLRESMAKEDRHRNNDKEVYEKLKHKVASAQHTNGEVLEPNFLQRDLKPAQIVGIYERQKVVLETEISNLRAENAQLCREISEKENIILNKVLGTEETKKALDLLSRKQQLQIDDKIKEICRLEDELKERPTMEEVEETIRSASHQEEASKQFHERAQYESFFEKILRQICQLLELEEPSYIVKGFVPASELQQDTHSVSVNLRWVDDHVNHFLDIYQETLESLLVLVSAVPRMEQFVSDVCDVVFCDGQNWSPPSNDGDAGANRTPEAVPGLLKSWIQKLEESSELLTFKDTIVGMLWERVDKNSELEPEMSCRVVIGCVKNLIDVEQDYLATKASYSDADTIIKAEPQKVLHRIVAHFQMLFEVPKLEGVMAVMNSVYIKCTEYHNFARALSSMLGLDKEEGPNTIISTVNSIMLQHM